MEWKVEKERENERMSAGLVDVGLAKMMSELLCLYVYVDLNLEKDHPRGFRYT